MEKAHILVVEDEVIIASDIQLRLQTQGYVVAPIVTTGEDAVKKAGEDRPDLVLMDIFLPGKMDGIEAASTIRSRYDIPVIFLTSYADEAVLERAKITEPFGYLVKPVEDRELYITIEIALFQYHIEKRLRESENKYRTLLENLPQKIFYKDKDSVYVSCNRNYARDLNIEPDQIIGKTDHDFFPAELAEKYIADDKKIIESGKIEDLEEEYVRDGQKRYVQMVKTPVKGEKDTTVGILGIFWDITERKQSEEELKKYRLQLEELVKERTSELIKANEQLQLEIAERKRMEKQIKSSLKEKEILLKEIHHRVRNNLQIIYGLLNIQTDYIEDKRYIDIFKGFQNRVMSMALVHKILYQSRNFASVDFHDYIKNLVTKLFQSCGVSTDSVALIINVKDISLGVDTAIPCGLIINELVSNSLRHAFPEGKKGEIRIALHPINKSGFELSVSDNGIGLSEDLDFRNTKTLGLKTLAFFEDSEFFGKIDLNRAGGTEFRIKIKVR